MTSERRRRLNEEVDGSRANVVSVNVARARHAANQAVLERNHRIEGLEEVLRELDDELVEPLGTRYGMFDWSDHKEEFDRTRRQVSQCLDGSKLEEYKHIVSRVPRAG